MPTLEPLVANKYTVKESSNFANEIAKQDSSNFMGSLDIDLFFTSIPLEESIETGTNNLFKTKDIAHGLKKSEFEELVSLAMKELYFIFNNILYKQIDEVAIGYPLEPSLMQFWLTRNKIG